MVKMKLLGSALALGLAAVSGYQPLSQALQTQAGASLAAHEEILLRSYAQAFCEKGCDLATVLATNQH